jgi:WD40 repeat protein
MKYMVTAGNDFKCRVLDPHNQDLLATLKGHKGPVLDVDISADCRCAVSASADKTLRVWNCDTYECLQHCIGHFGPVLSCSFGGTGKKSQKSQVFLQLCNLLQPSKRSFILPFRIFPIFESCNRLSNSR